MSHANLQGIVALLLHWGVRSSALEPPFTSLLNLKSYTPRWIQEILHHLGSPKYLNYWGIVNMGWCKISSIHSNSTGSGLSFQKLKLEAWLCMFLEKHSRLYFGLSGSNLWKPPQNAAKGLSGHSSSCPNKLMKNVNKNDTKKTDRQSRTIPGKPGDSLQYHLPNVTWISTTEDD